MDYQEQRSFAHYYQIQRRDGKVPIILGRVYVPLGLAVLWFAASIALMFWVMGWWPWSRKSTAGGGTADEDDDEDGRQFTYISYEDVDSEEEDMQEDDEKAVGRKSFYRLRQYRGAGNVGRVGNARRAGNTARVGADQVVIKLEPRDRDHTSVPWESPEPEITIKREPKTPEPSHTILHPERTFPFTPVSKSSRDKTFSTTVTPTDHFRVLAPGQNFNADHQRYPSSAPTTPATPTSTPSPHSKSRVPSTPALPFKAGDYVLRRRPAHLRIHSSHSSRDPYEGPFQLLSLHYQPPSSSSRSSRHPSSRSWAKLNFPRSSKASPYIKLSELKKFEGLLEDNIETGPMEIDEEGFEIYEVEMIRAVKGEGANTRYLVHWRGWPGEDDTWEPRAELSQQVVDEFENREKKWAMEHEAVHGLRRRTLVNTRGL